MKTKKIVILSALIFVGLTSCKKDYTCECITTSTESSETKTELFVQEKSKKNDAKEACQSLDFTENLEVSGSITRKCNLK